MRCPQWIKNLGKYLSLVNMVGYWVFCFLIVLDVFPPRPGKPVSGIPLGGGVSFHVSVTVKNILGIWTELFFLNFAGLILFGSWRDRRKKREAARKQCGLRDVHGVRDDPCDKPD